MPCGGLHEVDKGGRQGPADSAWDKFDKIHGLVDIKVEVVWK